VPRSERGMDGQSEVGWKSGSAGGRVMTERLIYAFTGSKTRTALLSLNFEVRDGHILSIGHKNENNKQPILIF
jgi:hypothetical protein